MGRGDGHGMGAADGRQSLMKDPYDRFQVVAFVVLAVLAAAAAGWVLYVVGVW